MSLLDRPSENFRFLQTPSVTPVGKQKRNLDALALIAKTCGVFALHRRQWTVGAAFFTGSLAFKCMVLSLNDYEDPDALQKMRNQARNQSFSKIVTRHSLENLHRILDPDDLERIFLEHNQGRSFFGLIMLGEYSIDDIIKYKLLRTKTILKLFVQELNKKQDYLYFVGLLGMVDVFVKNSIMTQEQANTITAFRECYEKKIHLLKDEARAPYQREIDVRQDCIKELQKTIKSWELLDPSAPCGVLCAKAAIDQSQKTVDALVKDTERYGLYIARKVVEQTENRLKEEFISELVEIQSSLLQVALRLRD